jgi:excisionase family DNA binding protein
MDTMTAKEVCEALGISMMTLHRRIAEGEIAPLPKAPALRRRHRLLFRKEDVDRLQGNMHNGKAVA